MASVSNFTYTPLEDPEESLRLLQLLPEKHNYEGLYATLTPFRRDATPPYRPASYTWGAEAPLARVLIRSHGQQECARFLIRPNLEALLRQVRSSLRAQYIWVDAICINQTDNIEKGHQALNMHHIYRDKPLFIWLGTPSDNSTHAMNLMDDFWNRYEGAGWAPGSREAMHAGYDFNKSISTSETSSASWIALYDLAYCPWFIVRKFVLSGPKDFWVGSRHQNFLAMIYLVLFLRECPIHLGEGETRTDLCQLDAEFPHYLPPSVIDPIDRLECLWSAYLASQTGDTTGRTSEHLLHNFSGFASYDPRDGIYAFISMASNIYLSEWFPDYSEQNTPLLLYLKATFHIMSHGDSLDIMAPL